MARCRSPVAASSAGRGGGGSAMPASAASGTVDHTCSASRLVPSSSRQAPAAVGQLAQGIDPAPEADGGARAARRLGERLGDGAEPAAGYRNVRPAGRDPRARRRRMSAGDEALTRRRASSPASSAGGVSHSLRAYGP